MGYFRELEFQNYLRPSKFPPPSSNIPPQTLTFLNTLPYKNSKIFDNQKFKMKQLTVFLSLLLFATIITAQETIDSTKNSPLEISGSADVYYQYNTNGLPLETTAYTGVQNSFSPGMAKVAIAKSFGKTSFRADVGFGPRANSANGSNFPNLQQLFVTYSPNEDLTFTLGNFGTFVGYEMIDPTDNFHYSLSYMFSYGPFFHTGVKADYAVNDKLGLMVGLFNDTDTKIDVINSKKHFGAQVSYALEAGDVYLNYLTGTDGVDTVTFNQVDLTADFDLSDKFSLGLNSTLKSISEEKSDAVNWYGAAVYLGYEATDNFSLGMRGEYIHDGTTAIFDASPIDVPEVSVFATTLSVNIKIDKLTLIPEFRLDSASENIFVQAGDTPGFSSVSPTFIFAAVYGF